MTQALATGVRRGGEQFSGEVGARLAMSTELQRLWKDVFEQSRVVPAGEAGQSLEAAQRGAAVGTPPGMQRPGALTVLSQFAAVPRAVNLQVASTSTAPAAPNTSAKPSTSCTGETAGTFSRVKVQLDAQLAPVLVAPMVKIESISSASNAPLAGIATTAQPPCDLLVASEVEPELIMAITGLTLTRACTEPVDTTSEARPFTSATDIGEMPPDEVIQIFQRDGALEIVIRDSTLDPRAALRCALETARQLTGDARTLRQLMLNGRCVFSHHERNASPRTLVSFSC